MKNIIRIFFVSGILLLSTSGCVKVKPLDIDNKPQELLLKERDMKKWAQEKQLQQEQNEADEVYKERVKKAYEEYYKNLREYKKSSHRVVYGWFSGWTATEGVDRSFLCNLPDSVDIVALWGGVPEFDETDPRWEDLRIAQEVKGLQVVLCWQTGASGLGLPGGVEAFNKRHAGKTSEQKATEYAKELTAFIKKHNLNGYDIDWEPNVGNHGHGIGNNLYNNDTGGDRNAPLKAFVEEMGKNFGPKKSTDYDPRGTGTLFLFDGEIKDFATRAGSTLGGYFDYFINQNYTSIGPNHEFVNPESTIADFTWKKYIQADEFERYGGTGGFPGSYSGGVSMAEAKAKQNVEKDYGGWAAYHIELDKNYKWTQRVIRIMNPRNAFYPDENKDNLFED